MSREVQVTVDAADPRVHRFAPEPPMSGGFLVMTDPEGNEFCLD